LQLDGRVLVGGTFTTVNGVARIRIARVNSDGSLDTPFQNGMSGVEGDGFVAVYAVALQPDGKALLGGEFTFVNDTGRHRIARLHTDGSLDTGFENGPPGPHEFNSVNSHFVYGVAAQPDGKVVIGGDFTSVHGVLRSRIARLNSDGTLDTGFQNGMAGASVVAGGITVNAVAVQPDGKVLMGGRFSTVNGVARSGIARLNTDGSLDTTFQNGMAGLTLTVTPAAALALQPDGKVVVGGFFTTVNGVARTNIARLNADGSLDTTFQNGMAGANGVVFALALQLDGKVLIGGFFTTVNGTARSGIARLNSDGSLDTGFQNGMAGASLPRVESISVQTDGRVLIGGGFGTVNGVSRIHLARLQTDGSLDTTFLNGLAGPNGSVADLLVQPDSKVLVGGTFSSINGVARFRIARVNTDGSLDTTFQNGLAGVSNINDLASATVESLALQSDGKVLIGGGFNMVNGVVRERVARLLSTGTDITPPTITCPANQVASTDPGQCSAVVNYPPATASDDCSSVTVSCVPASGATFSTGAATVNCTATDASGNTATCSFTVTVNDTEPPTLVCPTPIDADTDPGQCTALLTFTPTSTDNCPGVGTVICTPASGTAFPKGTTTVNCSVSDAAGNAGSCSFTVTVADNELPAITCPANVIVNTDPGLCTASGVAFGSPTATDNCGVASVMNNAPGVFPKGMTTVTWTVIDTSGNTAQCQQTVAVTDNEPPVITCPANIAVNTGAGQCSAVVSFTVSATDNCTSVGTVTCAPASGAAFPKGTTTVNCSVSDAAGNASSCSFTVTVTDNELPTIACPSPVSANTDAGLCTASGVVLGSPVTADNCAVASVANDAPAAFPQGTTLVTWTVTDPSGNTAQCQQTVTVTDNEPPTLACAAPAAANTDPGQCIAVVNFNPTAADNCAGVGSVICTPASGTPFPKGNTTVTCSVSDAAGNPGSCSFTVTVNDTEPPTIACPANVTVNTDAGLCTASGVALGSPTTADNCGVASVVNNAPGVFPKGVTTVAWTVTDTSGNTAQCQHTVTVVDNEPPAIACPANVTVNTDTGLCAASGVALGSPATADNCAIASVVNDAPAAFPKGITIVTWLVTDTSGNAASCQQTVTVTDNEPPTLTCPADIDVSAGSFCGGASGVVTFPTPAGADNCGIAGVSCAPPSGTTFPAGSTTVTCTATDTSGNTAQCAFTVTVQSGGGGACEAIQSCPDRSRVHFGQNGNSQFAFFRGSLELTGGNLAPDFRVVPGSTARGALKVTLGGTVVYCNDNLTFTIHDCSDPANNREKWQFNAGPMEKMFLRWKDDQEYDATRDPNLPVSAATGNRNLGKLETRFIHADETRFRYNFKDATKPVTITVDGFVLVTVSANGSVTSPFPHWKYGKVVEVLFPDRLVPGNTIAWYNDGDLSNNGGLPENLVYQHDASANGNATDTYFNAGGRFFIKVPVAGVSLTSLPRSAQVQFTLGEPGVTQVGCGDFAVPSYTVVGQNWKFNDGPDDCENED
jgi:uncharacterized delta-60 repeat protein